MQQKKSPADDLGKNRLKSCLHFLLYNDMPGKYLDNACADCQAVVAALNIRNRQLCQ